MSPAHRVVFALTVLVIPITLPAQVPRSPATNCGGTDSRMLRSVMGATAGAIVGLVAVNIRYSDWSDRQPRNLGTVRLNAGIVGGLLGASLGNVKVPSCATARPSQQKARGAYAAITAEEIERSAITGSVYELVYSLRRAWLNTRGIELSEMPQVHGDARSGVVVTPGNPTIMVYLDNGKMGDMEALKSMAVAGVTAVKFYDAAQATQRWGAGHNHGAIQVLTTAADAAR